MNRIPRIALGLVIGAVVGAASGCGPGKVTVTGKVTKGDQVLKSTTGHVEVKLIPADAVQNYTTIPTVVENDGTFKITDVPVGKYKIAVHLLDTPQTDGLNGQFDDTKTQIIRDIDGKKPLNIDVSKADGGPG